MDSKDKALKLFLGTVAVLAAAMVAYYWVAWRTRTTEHDLNLADRGGPAAVEQKAEFAGMYSAADPLEGLERRVNYFTLSPREDGSGGYQGTAKIDRVASTEAAEEYIRCPDVKVAEKDFFIKCSSPELGQLSFVGEWSRGEGGIQVAGKFLWAKDAAEVTALNTTLTHTPN